jgi:hypothetical protein
MNTTTKLLVLALFLTAVGLQTGCDQNDAFTPSESPAFLGKGMNSNGLGARLAADPDFQELRKILHDGDQRARIRHFSHANLKRDEAFAKLAERKGALSASDKSRLAEMRGLTVESVQKVATLREAIIERFPEIESLSEAELREVLAAAGVGSANVVGKTTDQCDDCNYAYNSCITNAQVRHTIELLSCALLIETAIGATVCYLASATKYMWTVSSCTRSHQYCQANNGCLNSAGTDTA